ncbi:MAG: hypothetical protein RR276_04045, partial [Angelakisella sp.]
MAAAQWRKPSRHSGKDSICKKKEAIHGDAVAAAKKKWYIRSVYQSQFPRKEWSPMEMKLNEPIEKLEQMIRDIR